MSGVVKVGAPSCCRTGDGVTFDVLGVPGAVFGKGLNGVLRLLDS